jgi:Tfp pilus assembly protein PilZ
MLKETTPAFGPGHAMNQKPFAANRRDSYRRRSKSEVRLSCRRVADHAELAVALLDASQTGLRLVVREELAKGEEVVVTLTGPDCPSVELPARVIWSVPEADDTWTIGVRIHERLPYLALIRLTEL